MNQLTSPRIGTQEQWVAFLTEWFQVRTWRSLGYLLLGLPLGIIYFTFLVTGFSVSGGLLVIYAGIPLLALTFMGARVFSKLDADVANVLQGANIVLPPNPWTGGGSLWARTKRTLVNRATWKGIVYLFAMFPIGIASFVTTVVLVASAFGGATAWFWGRWSEIDVASQEEALLDVSWSLDNPLKASWQETSIIITGGVVLIFVLPRILNFLASTKSRFAYLMLSDSGAVDAQPRGTGEVALTPEEQSERTARSRVLELKLFYTHASLFAGVNVLLVIIDLVTGGGLWFYWSLIGWGTGLAVHAATVYMPFFGGEWDDLKFQELLHRGNS